MTDTDDKSPFPAPAYLVHTLERSRFKGHQMQGFDGCDVVWALWLPEDDDGKSGPPKLFARVVRGRDIDPTTPCHHGAQMVPSEADAFDLQQHLGDAHHYTEDGRCYAEDDHVPSHWHAFLNRAAVGETDHTP